ncbi:MAG TPA: FBP domain-containing protein [Actinomycetales bacterium]
MQPLSEAAIRGSMRNCSKGERTSLTLPALAAVAWDQTELLGWRDPRSPRRGYLVTVVDGEPVGVALRAGETRVRRKAMCDLCRCTHDDGVALFVAPRAGRAGRDGNTVGTYVCDDLACSRHLRAEIKPSRAVPDVGPLVAARGLELEQRAAGFFATVLTP